MIRFGSLKVVQVPPQLTFAGVGEGAIVVVVPRDCRSWSLYHGDFNAPSHMVNLTYRLNKD